MSPSISYYFHLVQLRNDKTQKNKTLVTKQRPRLFQTSWHFSYKIHLKVIHLTAAVSLSMLEHIAWFSLFWLIAFLWVVVWESRIWWFSISMLQETGQNVSKTLSRIEILGYEVRSQKLSHDFDIKICRINYQYFRKTLKPFVCLQRSGHLYFFIILHSFIPHVLSW